MDISPSAKNVATMREDENAMGFSPGGDRLDTSEETNEDHQPNTDFLQQPNGLGVASNRTMIDSLSSDLFVMPSLPGLSRQVAMNDPDDVAVLLQLKIGTTDINIRMSVILSQLILFSPQLNKYQHQPAIFETLKHLMLEELKSNFPCTTDAGRMECILDQLTPTLLVGESIIPYQLKKNNSSMFMAGIRKLLRMENPSAVISFEPHHLLQTPVGWCLADGSFDRIGHPACPAIGSSGANKAGDLAIAKKTVKNPIAKKTVKNPIAKKKPVEDSSGANKAGDLAVAKKTVKNPIAMKKLVEDSSDDAFDPKSVSKKTASNGKHGITLYSLNSSASSEEESVNESMKGWKKIARKKSTSSNDNQKKKKSRTDKSNKDTDKSNKDTEKRIVLSLVLNHWNGGVIAPTKEMNELMEASREFEKEKNNDNFRELASLVLKHPCFKLLRPTPDWLATDEEYDHLIDLVIKSCGIKKKGSSKKEMGSLKRKYESCRNLQQKLVEQVVEEGRFWVQRQYALSIDYLARGQKNYLLGELLVIKQAKEHYAYVEDVDQRMKFIAHHVRTRQSNSMKTLYTNQRYPFGKEALTRRHAGLFGQPKEKPLMLEVAQGRKHDEDDDDDSGL